MPDNLKDVGGGVKQFVPEQGAQSQGMQTLQMLNLANQVGNAGLERQKLETQGAVGKIDLAAKFWETLPRLTQENLQKGDAFAKQVFGPEAEVTQVFDLKTGRPQGFKANLPISDKPIFFGPQDALSPQQRFQNTQTAFENFVKQPDNAVVIDKRNALRDILNNATLALEAKRKGLNKNPYEQQIASAFVRFQGPGTIQYAEFTRSLGVDSAVEQLKNTVSRLTDGKTGYLTEQGVKAYIDFAQQNMKLYDESIQMGARPYINFGPQYGLDANLFNEFVGNYKMQTQKMNQRASDAMNAAPNVKVDQKAPPSQRMQQIIQQNLFRKKETK